MRKFFLVSLISGALALAGQPAFADHRGHGYHKQHHYGQSYKRDHYKHHRRHGHRRHKGVDGDDLIVAAGILGGAVVLGSVLSRPSYAAPQYYEPAPVYSPPPPRPYCVVDDVYRYLPDGRVQWGERTTCY